MYFFFTAKNRGEIEGACCLSSLPACESARVGETGKFSRQSGFFSVSCEAKKLFCFDRRKTDTNVKRKVSNFGPIEPHDSTLKSAKIPPQKKKERARICLLPPYQKQCHFSETVQNFNEREERRAGRQSVSTVLLFPPSTTTPPKSCCFPSLPLSLFQWHARERGEGGRRGELDGNQRGRPEGTTMELQKKNKGKKKGDTFRLHPSVRR